MIKEPGVDMDVGDEAQLTSVDFNNLVTDVENNNTIDTQ